jgi:hypothetical protein
MKKEYDFSTAQRGKFFIKGVKLNLPVYLNQESSSFVVRLARQRKTDMSSVVNDLIKGDMQLAQIMQ